MLVAGVHFGEAFLRVRVKKVVFFGEEAVSAVVFKMEAEPVCAAIVGMCRLGIATNIAVAGFDRFKEMQADVAQRWIERGEVKADKRQ